MPEPVVTTRPFPLASTVPVNRVPSVKTTVSAPAQGAESTNAKPKTIPATADLRMVGCLRAKVITTALYPAPRRRVNLMRKAMSGQDPHTVMDGLREQMVESRTNAELLMSIG